MISFGWLSQVTGRRGLGGRQGPYRHCLRSQDVTPGLAKGLERDNPWGLKTTEAEQG